MSDNTITVGWDQAFKLGCKVLRAGLVPHFIGSPGEGKSALFQAMADKFKLLLIDERLSTNDPTDQKGLPTINGKKASYLPFDCFPLEGDPIPNGYRGFLLAFDELDSAPPSVIASAYKVILDKKVGNAKLHPRCLVAAAGNKLTDGAIVNKTGTAMQSRMVHFMMQLDIDNFLKYISRAKWDHRVVAFLNFQPSLINNFTPKHGDINFACQRTWEFMSKLCKNEDTIDYDLLPMLAGTVGAGVAHNFLAFNQFYGKVPTIEEIQDDPLGCRFDDEPGIHWATCSLIGDRMNKLNAAACIKFLEQMDIDMQLMAMRSAWARDKANLGSIPEVQAWCRRNADEFLD